VAHLQSAPQSIQRKCRNDSRRKRAGHVATGAATIRNLLMAWVLALPAAIMLSAGLYVLFANLF